MLRWGGPAAGQLAQFALSTASPHLADMHAGGKRDFSFGANMWANINPVGASNALHCHPGATWSGVYYVDDGGASEEGPAANWCSKIRATRWRIWAFRIWFLKTPQAKP